MIELVFLVFILIMMMEPLGPYEMARLKMRLANWRNRLLLAFAHIRRK